MCARTQSTTRLKCTILTQIRDGVSVDQTSELDGPLEDGMGDPTVEESEALGFASFTGQLPQHLHTAGVHHLGEEGWRGWSCVEKRGKKEL